MKDYTIEEIKLDTIPEVNYPAVALPDTEDYYTDTLPLSAGQANRKRKILVPELTSMTKYLFDPSLGNQRLPLYSYLNRLLRTGRLSSVVGFRVMDKSINMRKNGETRETMSEKLNTTSKSLREWLMDPENSITIDFVVVIALLWKLPDWISLMLLDRACIHLNEYDRRRHALDHILRVLWDKGIDEANRFLGSMNLDPLKY